MLIQYKFKPQIVYFLKKITTLNIILSNYIKFILFLAIAISRSIGVGLLITFCVYVLLKAGRFMCMCHSHHLFYFTLSKVSHVCIT